jgi:hypothetical protein
MGFHLPYDDGMGGIDPPPPAKKDTGGRTAGISPGAITSTGGLFGGLGLLLIPVFNAQSNSYFLTTWDGTNFDTEEDCHYEFRQEDLKVGYAATDHKIIVIYRNLGKVKVTFNLTVFRRGLTTYEKNVAVIQQGTYKTVSKTMELGSNPPDKKLYTIDFNMVNSGERPQISFDRRANKGPLSIISVTLCGNVDEKMKL